MWDEVRYGSILGSCEISVFFSRCVLRGWFDTERTEEKSGRRLRLCKGQSQGDKERKRCHLLS